MVMPDFDVCRRSAGRAAAEEYAFGRGFQEVVGDFVRAARQVAVTSADYLGIGAGAYDGNTVEVISVGINQSSIGDSAHVDSVLVFVLRSSGEPHPIKINMVRGARRSGNVLEIDSGPGGSRDF